MTDYLSHLAGATGSLKAALGAVSQEINAYPTPISGCDAQFNFLLAERTKLEAALRALGSEIFVPTPRTLNPGDPIECR